MAKNPARPIYKTSDLEPITPNGSNFSSFEATPGEFFYLEQCKFDRDSGYSSTALIDRAISAVKRAIGSDSQNRIGHFYKGNKEIFENLPEFSKDAVLEVVVRVYVPVKSTEEV
jgi:hypothetical protein